MDDRLIAAYREHGKLMEDNMKERMIIYQRMDNDIRYAYAQVEMSKRDIFHFFKYHLWTHDPRKNMLDLYGFSIPQLPFLLFDFQKSVVVDTIESIENGHDILVEKSRDMGVSWIMTAISLWYWLQNTGGNDILLGSRKFDYVDKKGSLDTLIEKIRYNLYMLHPRFMPDGFDANRHDNVGNILNPETGSFIRGEANNPNFATSGRYRFIIADEFSKWEETDEQAWTSMGDSSPCRIPVSTPWGIGRKFAKLRFKTNIKVCTFHWTLHPIKSVGKWYDESQQKWRSPWYDAEVKRRSGDNDAADIGQELDIDYLSSGHPYFDNMIIQREFGKLELVKLKRYEFIRHQDADGIDYLELFPAVNGRLWINMEPEEGWKYRYGLSADVAEGLEHGDNSVFYVYDRVEGIDVAGFCGKIDTDTYELLIRTIAEKYSDAYIASENNSMGAAVIQRLKDNYTNIYTEQRFDQVVDVDTVKLGYNTNKRTRGIMLGKLSAAIRDGVHGIVEKEVFSECLTFINKNGKPQAESGNADDRIMAQAIKWMLHDWLPAPEKVSDSVDPWEGYSRFGGGEMDKQEEDIRVFW